MRRGAAASVAIAVIIAACTTVPQQSPLHARHASETRDSQALLEPRPTAVSSSVKGLKKPLSTKPLALRSDVHPPTPVGYIHPTVFVPLHQTTVVTPSQSATESWRTVRQSLDARVLYIAGHTKNTANKGAFSASGLREHTYNDLVLEAIKQVTTGANALYLPSSLDLSLRGRPALPVRRGAHIYIEMHHDTGFAIDVARKAWNDLSGYSVFYSGNSLCASESALLAKSIGKAMREYGLKPSVYYTNGPQARHKVSIDKRNGVYESDFYVLENAKVPAVLVECGNIANPHEEALLASRRMMTAGAIREGVLAYLHR